MIQFEWERCEVAYADAICDFLLPLAIAAKMAAKAPKIRATEPKNSVRMTKSASGVGIPEVEKAVKVPEKP